MLQLLLVGRFSWVTPTLDDLLATLDDSQEGFLLEVYLEYPENLYDYTLALETREEWLRNYQRMNVNQLGVEFIESVKLMPSLHHKQM